MEPNRRAFAGFGLAPLFIASGVRGANDRPAFGLIAAGGRGRYLNSLFQKQGARCVAVCDVYQPNLDLALASSPGAKGYLDYRELLDKEKLDFVILAGPDHHHCPMLLEALAAGKDVYAEKPLSKTPEESARMVAAVRKTRQVVQIGMQRRSAPAVLAARKLVDDGVLGRVTLVKAQWHLALSKPLDNSPLPGKLDWTRFLGDAPKRPLEPMRFRWWRGFRDYSGGNMTDQGAHVMDVVQWFMKSGPPQTAVCQGYLAKMEGAEHPDVFSAVFRYPGFIATWTLDYCNSFQTGWFVAFMGDKATMILDNNGYAVYAEPWSREQTPIFQEKAVVPVDTHVKNFLECIASRREPNCPVEAAAQAVAGPHMANAAMFWQGAR